MFGKEAQQGVHLATQAFRTRTNPSAPTIVDEIELAQGPEDRYFVEGAVFADSGFIRLGLPATWTEQVAAQGFTMLDGYFVAKILTRGAGGRPAALLVLDTTGPVETDEGAWVVLRGAMARWDGAQVSVDASGPASFEYDFSMV